MNQSPKVLMCGPNRTAVSGVATHLNQLFESSIASKYRLYQFQVGSEGREEGRLQKLLRYVTGPLMFLATIIRQKPEIVHLNTSMDAKAFWRDLVYLCTAKLLGRRVVYQIHGGKLPSQFFGSNPLAQAFLRFSLRTPDVIVLLAQVECDDYRKFIISKRIEIVPNAINLNEYREMEAKDYKNENIVLGYIGRLAADKGIKETIEALASLRRQGSMSMTLRIAGAGPYESELRNIVKREALEACVEFCGPVFGNQKVLFWHSIDLFVFPTYHREGLPYAVLEALASGTPVISTPVGGIPDVIQDGVQGVLLHKHDSESVALAVKTLISDRERLRGMSLAAMQRAQEYYGIERLAMQFDRLYQELLA